jgi:hypothetical protein
MMAEISQDTPRVFALLDDVAEIQKRLDDETIITALRIATVTAQEVPVDEGTLRNSYHVHHSNVQPNNDNPLPAPPDKVTAVVGSVLSYAPVIEERGGRNGIGRDAFGSAYQQEVKGYAQRIGQIVIDYLNGK